MESCLDRVRIVRIGARTRMPWKNGGGETIEIASHPPGSGLGDFGWRVSIARMIVSGAFSTFPGVDRTLIVMEEAGCEGAKPDSATVESAGLELSIGAAPPIRLTAASAPLTFPGEQPCFGRLLHGPATNLNIMANRATFRHRASRLELTRPVLIGGSDLLLLVCVDGAVTSDEGELGLHDTLIVPAQRRICVTPRGATASTAVVSLRPSGRRAE